MSKARDLANLLGGGTSGAITFGGTAAIRVPNGTTAERPTPAAGMIRYNTTTGFAEVYDGNIWAEFGAPPPSISTVTPSTYNGESGTTFTINGANFTADATVFFITSGGTEVQSGTVSFVSGAQLTATTPQNFTVADEPLDVKVVQTSGQITKLDTIDCGGVPVWTTGSGTLGTIEGYDPASSLSTSTLIATDPEGGSVSYSIQTGSLPSGLTFSNGVISGTATQPLNSTTSAFTVRATDNINNTDRSFTITVIPAPDIYSVGDMIRPSSWNIVGAGVVAGPSPVNDLRVDTHTSWTADSISLNTTAASINGISSEFARHVTYWRSTSLETSGCVVFSGHANTGDPLAGKDVAFYYSTDTTNGVDGTWTRITPTGMSVAKAAKHASSTNFVGQRVSQVSGDHVVLSGNVQNLGSFSSGSYGYIYNRTGEMGDLIFWEPVTAKGYRMDVRTRWGNGYYSGEKPHIAMWSLFDNGKTIAANGLPLLEADSNTLLYIDPAVGRSYSGSGTALNDLSANNFDFDFSSNVPTGSVTHTTNDGGALVFSVSSLRKSGLRPSVTTGFTLGAWVKFGSQGIGGAGLLSYGTTDPAARKRFFTRTAFSNPSNYYQIDIGADIEGSDRWVHVPGENSQNTQAYFTGISGYATKYHFVVLRVHDNGYVDSSINGKQFVPVYYNGNDAAIGSLSSGESVFYLGGDGHNDNSSSNSYGPFFFYNGQLSFGQVTKEYNRYKTRFGW
jgi:hypothetical protein